MEIAYAQETAEHVAVNLNAFDAIWSASIVVKLTLLCLIGFSFLSWSIIWAKKKQFELVKKSDDEFLKYFWDSKSWDEVYRKIDEFKTSPVANVFNAGFFELQKIAETLGKSDSDSKKPRLTGIDNLLRALRKSVDLELTQIESRLSILATIGSTAPFIGLFGTVWGIMNAFQKIGATGAAHLAVVAPGISEALIATAVGLFAAIPAVIAYNYFVGLTKRSEMELQNFTSDFANIAKRNFFKEG
ncbi:MAG: protein TolQ [Bdellovibrionales bacterium]|nr:protein TolQ [Bdellovibrionales bacterium]